MAISKKISKEKGIELVTDWLYQGLSRKDILPKLAKICQVSDKTVTNWIRDARPLVKERQERDEEIRARESEALITAAVKEHGVTKERIIARLSQIAFGGVKDIFTVDGGLKQLSDLDEETAGMIAGIESFDEKHRETGELLGTNRKIKLHNPIEAVKTLNAMLGYNAATKSTITHKVGKDLIEETYE